MPIAFNLGIAGGAWGGGLIVTHMGLIYTAWIGWGRCTQSVRRG